MIVPSRVWRFLAVMGLGAWALPWGLPCAAQESAPAVDSPAPVAAQAPAAEPATGPAAERAAAADAVAEPRATKTLRFNFQGQPWLEVLQWLADQAELSLVLDAPPPGTFNYTDARRYSSDEAIDLVNGVLASKGYTLLRRERMLMLVNLQDEAPRLLVPRVPLEEIDARGNYEFVTVAIPLQGRDAEAALAEIQPLISQFGSAAALPASNQLLVTDRAGLMRAIAAVIESMPRPRGPEPKPEPTPGEAPEFRVYPLEGADAKAAVEILEAVASGKFAHDPAGDLLNAYATPSQHAIIEQLMQQIRGAADKREFRLEIYPLEGLDPARQTQLTADLQSSAANSRVRFDAEQEQLIVWATAEDHQVLRKALFTLIAAGGGSGTTKEAKVYVLQHADAAQVLPLLQAAAPQARLSPGGAPDRLLAIAAARDHALLGQLLPQIDAPDRRELLTLREYRLERELPSELSSLLAEAAPRAKLRVDAARRSVVAIGSPEDHQAIQQILAELKENLPPDTKPPLRIRVLTELQRERFANVRTAIEKAAPDAELVWNEQAGELFVWAEEEEQTAIDAILASLDAEPRRPPSKELRSYPAPAAQLETMTALVKNVAPEAVATPDRPGRRLLVWAEPDEHEQLAPLLERSATGEAAVEGPLSYRSYPAGEIDLQLATRVVSERFPAAEIEADSTARSLVARATEAEHRRIEELVRQLRSGATVRAAPEVQVYPLGGVDAKQAEGLRQVFPTMRISVDETSEQIAAWGTREEQSQFSEALAALGGKGTSGGWTIRVFPLEQAKASELAVGLPLLVPGINAAAINDAQLLVRCRADEASEVAQLIAQLDVHRGVSQRKQARTFPVKRADPLSLVTTLQTMFPPATGCAFSFDAQTTSLMAVADAPQMALVEAIISAADQQDSDGGQARVLQVYPLTGVDGQTAVSTLEKLFKERGKKPQISLDTELNRLVAVAEPQEQTLIADVLGELAPPATELEVFPLETMDPYSAELAIDQLFDGRSGANEGPVDVEADSDGGRILVRATLGQLEEIRALLVKMGEINLLATRSDASGTRFLPWNDDDPQEVLTRFLQSWRQMSAIPVEVRRAGENAAEPAPDAQRENEPDGERDDAASPPPAASASPASDSADAAPAGEPAPATVPHPNSTADRTTAEKPMSGDPVLEATEPGGPTTDSSVSAAEAATPQDTAVAAPAPELKQPATDDSSTAAAAGLRLTVGPHGVTIDASDPAAAAQAAAVLRSVTRDAPRGNQEFGVYPLSNASAERVANVLQSVYRDYGRGSRLRFAADERINAVIVKGSRTERRDAEALLEALDTSQEVAFYKPNQPVVLTLKYANAEQVHDQLETLYANELRRGARQPPIEIPPGADPEVVAMLQQINASREGPLLTLEVDEDTNSLLMIAPRSLQQEIEAFVQRVDAKSTESRIGVRVVPLESLQGSELLRSLESILNSRRR